MKSINTKTLPYGFKDMNGNEWPDEWVDSYNAYNDGINTAIHYNNKSILNFLLDRRHQDYAFKVNLLKENKEN